MLGTLTGLLGSTTSALMWFPQARTTYRNRRTATLLAALSVATLQLVVINACVWVAYAALANAWWSCVSGLFTAPLALAQIGWVLQARPETRTVRTLTPTPVVALLALTLGYLAATASGVGPANVFGAAGSVSAAMTWLPQARATFHNRHDRTAMAGVSLGTLGMVLLNNAAWVAYGYATGAWWACAPGLFTVPATIAQIGWVLRARRG